LSDGLSAEELFEVQRPRLLGLAYRMVSSRAEAEDIVSEAWVRWCAADRDRLSSPEAWLTTVTSRLCIDWLRSARHNRDAYVGPWLPEPVMTDPGPEERAELADSLTLGFLTLLDRLQPVERAVFLMADVFAVPYTDIAAAVDKTPAACRQIASRARRALQQAGRRPRVADRHLVDEVLLAFWTGDMEAVLARLAPDVVCVTDGGAHRRAARRPVVGAERVARFFTNLAERYRGQLSVTPATVNGEPGIIAYLDGVLDFVAAFEVDGRSVKTIRMVRNPDKLGLLTTPAHLL
jgi:RNA polymerase sigma-70 factor (ECF subfamily)